MSEKKTYLITTTRAELPDLWLVQTEDMSKLVQNLAIECSGLKRGAVFTLTLDPVQRNNCFEGKLLNREVDVNGRESFYLFIQEALQRCIWNTPAAERPILLAAAIDRLQKELDRQMKGKEVIPLEGDNQK